MTQVYKWILSDIISKIDKVQKCVHSFYEGKLHMPTNLKKGLKNPKAFEK